MKNEDAIKLKQMAEEHANSIPILAIDANRNLLVDGKQVPTFEFLEKREKARVEAFRLRQFVQETVKERKQIK
jgi:hypothetical protein